MTIQNIILKSGNWKAIHAEVFEDPRLSLEAKAVAGFIITRSDSFKPRPSGICRILKIGKDKWRRIRNELELAGYLDQTQSNGPDGKFLHKLDFAPIPKGGFIAGKKKFNKKLDAQPAAAKPPTDEPRPASQIATKDPDYLIDPPPSPNEGLHHNLHPAPVEAWQEIAQFEAEEFARCHKIKNFDGLLFRINQRYQGTGGPSLRVLAKFHARVAEQEQLASTRNVRHALASAAADKAAEDDLARTAAKNIAQAMNLQERQRVLEQAALALPSFKIGTNAKQAFLVDGVIMSGPFAAIIEKLLLNIKGDT